MTLWKDTLAGFGGHSWYTATTSSQVCYATWTPALPQPGSYEVFAYIPPGSTASAWYVVTHGAGVDTVPVDQRSASGTWATGGIFSFTSSGSVQLGSGSDVVGSRIGFDAVRWNHRGVPSAGGVIPPDRFVLRQNFPNPFNPSTNIRYEIRERAYVRLEVVDLLGRTVDILENGYKLPGAHVRIWEAGSMAAGMYLCVLTVHPVSGVSEQSVRKMILLR